MSITNHNGTITLTSFAELGEVLDHETFPDAPATAEVGERCAEASSSQGMAVFDLAALMAELASLSGGVETMAREDARAREQATIELARYEALVAECSDTEHALAEARRVRAAAEHLALQAFSDGARARAAQDVAAARVIERHCIELLAERTRVTEELATSPNLARALAEQQRLAEQQIESARRAESQCADRLAISMVAVTQALTRDEIDHARKLLVPLAREFPDNDDVRRKMDIVRWRLRNRHVAPAEAALRDISRKPYRDDAEATLKRLAEVHTEGLPEDLARRVFGLWSNACFRVVEQRGWHEPRRHAPITSRGAVWARPELGAPYEVVSSLDEARWRPGETVPEEIAVKAPQLKAGAAHRPHAADLAA